MADACPVPRKEESRSAEVMAYSTVPFEVTARQATAFSKAYTGAAQGLAPSPPLKSHHQGRSARAKARTKLEAS